MASPAGGEDSVLGAVGDVVQQMAQGLARMQDAMRQQHQEAQRHFEERLQDTFRQQLQEVHVQHEARLQVLQLEALRLQEQKLQEDFQQHLQAALHQQEARFLAALRREGRVDGSELMHTTSAGAAAQLEGLEARMHKLEESVERALADVVPRVDAVLVHLERQPAAAAAPDAAPPQPQLQPAPPAHEDAYR
ncbi:Protein of unknown function, partial [Gryllus bimaculatus]